MSNRCMEIFSWTSLFSTVMMHKISVDTGSMLCASTILPTSERYALTHLCVLSIWFGVRATEPEQVYLLTPLLNLARAIVAPSGSATYRCSTCGWIKWFLATLLLCSQATAAWRSSSTSHSTMWWSSTTHSSISRKIQYVFKISHALIYYSGKSAQEVCKGSQERVRLPSRRSRQHLQCSRAPSCVSAPSWSQSSTSSRTDTTASLYLSICTWSALGWWWPRLSGTLSLYCYTVTDLVTRFCLT
jgi:hypothetical protein